MKFTDEQIRKAKKFFRKFLIEEYVEDVAGRYDYYDRYYCLPEKIGGFKMKGEDYDFSEKDLKSLIREVLK